jgi:hypothetical protein
MAASGSTQSGIHVSGLFDPYVGSRSTSNTIVLISIRSSSAS